MVFPGSGEEVVRYGYDHGGLVSSAVGENQRVNPQHPDEPRRTEYLRHIGYDEFGQRVRVVAGNGVETRYRYDESTRRMAEVNADHQDARMRSLGRPARPFQRLRYRYDLVGNVKELSNEVPLDESLGGSVMVAATQQRFEYDDLNQLKEASGSYQERRDAQLRYTLGLSYDAIGNVTEKGQEVARYVPDGARGWKQQEPIRERTYRNEYRYTGPRPHAPTEVDEVVVGESSPRLRELLYDASGNQVDGSTGPTRSEGWSGTRRPGWCRCRRTHRSCRGRCTTARGSGGCTGTGSPARRRRRTSTSTWCCGTGSTRRSTSSLTIRGSRARSTRTSSGSRRSCTTTRITSGARSTSPMTTRR
ncbi:RHS repeat protein [Sorangium cellulosum]|uniref:RHS repeat protein n=1 Tax=Sorangium cellulosum TaxID=56 RepID=UPI001F47D522|nr:RHS repeat protein [Sorangium cellulosum]